MATCQYAVCVSRGILGPLLYLAASDKLVEECIMKRNKRWSFQVRKGQKRKLNRVDPGNKKQIPILFPTNMHTLGNPYSFASLHCHVSPLIFAGASSKRITVQVKRESQCLIKACSQESHGMSQMASYLFSLGADILDLTICHKI